MDVVRRPEDPRKPLAGRGEGLRGDRGGLLDHPLPGREVEAVGLRPRTGHLTDREAERADLPVPHREVGFRLRLVVRGHLLRRHAPVHDRVVRGPEPEGRRGNVRQAAAKRGRLAQLLRGQVLHVRGVVLVRVQVQEHVGTDLETLRGQVFRQGQRMRIEENRHVVVR